MARNKKLLRFRYVFNKLPDNIKSISVFATCIGCFLLIGLLTGFSHPGLLAGCVASYICLYLRRPLRAKRNI